MDLNRRQFIVAGTAAVAATGVAGTAAHADQSGGGPGHGGGSAAPRGMWLVGDTHVHDDHSSDGSLPRQESSQTLPGNLPVGDQIGQAELTGLDFVPLTDHRTYDQHWDPQWTSAELLLIPGEEANGSPHAIVLGAVDVIVDGANPPGSRPSATCSSPSGTHGRRTPCWHVAHPDDGEFTKATARTTTPARRASTTSRCSTSRATRTPRSTTPRTGGTGASAPASRRPATATSVRCGR